MLTLPPWARLVRDRVYKGRGQLKRLGCLAKAYGFLVGDVVRAKSVASQGDHGLSSVKLDLCRFRRSVPAGARVGVPPQIVGTEPMPFNSHLDRGTSG